MPVRGEFLLHISPARQSGIEIQVWDAGSFGIAFEPAIQAYPNPARTLINIRGASTGQSLQLSNMFGKVMRNQVITNTEPTIDLDGLQPGIYVLVVSNERGEEVTRTRINKQ